MQPLGCTEFPVLRFNPGKPGLTVQDVKQALKDQDNPLGEVRGVSGDTASTRAAIAAYQAVRKELGCANF